MPVKCFYHLFSNKLVWPHQYIKHQNIYHYLEAISALSWVNIPINLSSLSYSVSWMSKWYPFFADISFILLYVLYINAFLGTIIPILFCFSFRISFTIKVDFKWRWCNKWFILFFSILIMFFTFILFFCFIILSTSNFSNPDVTMISNIPAESKFFSTISFVIKLLH